MMQSNIDLMVAYANKIALGLAAKEHAVNDHMIQKEGRNVYALNMHLSTTSFRKYSGPDGDYNVHEQESLCNQALEMVQTSMNLNIFFSSRAKQLIESAFTRSLTLVKQEDDDAEDVSELPLDSLSQLDLLSKWSKQKIRHFVIANYRKTPYDIKSLTRTLGVPVELVKQWIQYQEKTERMALLREEVITLALHQTVTFAEFKKMARKIYRTRLFRATDNWCINFIRKNRLENIISIPEPLTKP